MGCACRKKPTKTTAAAKVLKSPSRKVGRAVPKTSTKRLPRGTRVRK